MLNLSSLRSVQASTFSTQFIHPLYDSYCFSQLPTFIQNRLGLEKKKSLLPKDVLGSLPVDYDQVVLIVLDAFGWRFWEKYKDRYPFLKRFMDVGVVSQLTSQFPSTTACHMTTIHTGLPVSESGIYEWFYYEPQVDQIIAPLLFSLAGDHERNSLLKKGFSPTTFFPKKTLYDELAKAGISSFVLQHANYTPSPFSDVVFHGAKVFGYKSIEESLSLLADLLGRAKEKSYFFLYIDAFDTTCHIHGPNSQALDETADRIFTNLEREFFQKLKRTEGKTLLAITADHGQVEVNPDTTHYLNLEIPGVEKMLRKNRHGETLLMGGSGRDLFLYVEQEHLLPLHKKLSHHFTGIAEVYLSEDLIQKNIFGSKKPSKALLDRLGNLVILPFAGESVSWYEKNRFEFTFKGHHGGLTPDEMFIPLLLLPLSKRA